MAKAMIVLGQYDLMVYCRAARGQLVRSTLTVDVPKGNVLRESLFLAVEQLLVRRVIEQR